MTIRKSKEGWMAKDGTSEAEAGLIDAVGRNIALRYRL